MNTGSRVRRHLDGMLDAIHERDDPYSVAWVDPRARGKALGRGVLTVGDHATLAELPPKLAKKARMVTGPPRLAESRAAPRNNSDVRR